MGLLPYASGAKPCAGDLPRRTDWVTVPGSFVPMASGLPEKRRTRPVLSLLHEFLRAYPR